MHSPSCSAPTKLCLRLHPNRDADMIAWLDTLAELPFGDKGEAVKAALRRGIGMEAASQPTVAADLLVQLRTVVEAAVTAALADAQAAKNTTTMSSETDALLDAFAEGLTL